MQRWRPTTRFSAGLCALALGPAAASAQQTRHFDIGEFRVEGNTKLAPALIERAVEPYLGPDRTLDDVERARAALDALYTRLGYATAAAEIPEQDPSDGVVILRVIERRVGRLRIKGSRYYALSDIRAHAPSVAEGEVPNINDIQRDVVNLNQWPDRRITPVLRPGAAPNTVDVDLNVADTLPLQGTVELTNRRIAGTTPLRLTASAGYTNVWQRGDEARVSYQLAPQRLTDSGLLTGSYLFRVPNTNLAALVSYLHSDSNVATLGGTGVVGRGNIYGFRLQVPFGTDGPFTHSGSFGFDYKAFRDTITLAAASSVTPIAYLPLVASYQASWIYDSNETQLSASATLGTRGIGSNDVTFDQKRYRATGGFAHLRAEVTRQDDLPYGLQSFVHVTGQLSNDALISNEQFSLGGVDTVRGYLEAEALGDYGGAIQTELRGPAYSKLIDATIDDIRPFGFADAGGVGIHNPLPQQKSGSALASAGAGVRIRVLETFAADLIGARVLTTGANLHEGTNRVLFRVNGAF